jgi:hypothetical protein
MRRRESQDHVIVNLLYRVQLDRLVFHLPNHGSAFVSTFEHYA